MSSLLAIIISAGLAGGLSSTLAALLLVAERYLVSYGACRIDINAGARELDVQGGTDLLMTLKNNSVFVPSACGGRGTCAFCKVKIFEGGGPVGPTESPLLTEEEIADNIRISCQCKVRNDLRLEIPESLLLVREYRGRVVAIRDLTYDMKELRIKLIEPETMEFVPGQYIQLEAPPYKGSRESVFRAYSVSSLPSDKSQLELIIRLVPGGICTTWVFNHLKEGDDVTFTGPFGDFRLTDSDREMVWVAGGSGMAPFWSMIRDMTERNIARKCTYFFGAAADKDMFFLEELNRLSKEHSWFTYVPALSQPEPDSAWGGQIGLITDALDKHVAAADGKEYYLCGSPGMIDAAMEILRAKGVPEEAIYYDKFD